MSELQSYIDEFEKQIPNYMPGLSVDCAIFGYENQQLKVLLLKWKEDNIWTLPGGFIYKDENMDDAAKRVLEERSGLKHIFLKQFHTFGKLHRSNQKQRARYNKTIELIKDFGPNKTLYKDWLKNRFITTGYFALTDIQKTTPLPDAISEKCEWKPLKSLPPLILDHGQIIDKAMEQLKIQLNYLPVGISLLPEKFTMQDLQKLYEAILQKPLERSNFQRKMLKLNFLNRHEKKMTGAANKAPYLYSFDPNKYSILLKEGIGFSY